MKTKMSLGDALRLGSAIVPEPHNASIERCGVGMIYAGLGVRTGTGECSTINLLYPAQIDKVWPCAWCDLDGLLGSCVVRHPFMLHYLTGEIVLEDLAEWLDFLMTGPEPSWAETEEKMRVMRNRATDRRAAAEHHEGSCTSPPHAACSRESVTAG